MTEKIVGVTLKYCSAPPLQLRPTPQCHVGEAAREGNSDIEQAEEMDEGAGKCAKFRLIRRCQERIVIVEYDI